MTSSQENRTKWLHRVKQQTGWWLGRSSAFNHWSHPLAGRKWPKEVLHSVSSPSMHASKQHRNSRIKCALLWFLHHRHVQTPATSSLKRFCSSRQVSCTQHSSCSFLSTAFQRPTQLIAPGRSENLQNHFKFPFFLFIWERKSPAALFLRTSSLKFEIFALWPKEVTLPADYFQAQLYKPFSFCTYFLHSRRTSAVLRQNPLS